MIPGRRESDSLDSRTAGKDAAAVDVGIAVEIYAHQVGAVGKGAVAHIIQRRRQRHSLRQPGTTHESLRLDGVQTVVEREPVQRCTTLKGVMAHRADGVATALKALQLRHAVAEIRRYCPYILAEVHHGDMLARTVERTIRIGRSPVVRHVPIDILQRVAAVEGALTYLGDGMRQLQVAQLRQVAERILMNRLRTFLYHHIRDGSLPAERQIANRPHVVREAVLGQLARDGQTRHRCRLRHIYAFNGNGHLGCVQDIKIVGVREIRRHIRTMVTRLSRRTGIAVVHTVIKSGHDRHAENKA